jgi:hypothetical protein
VRHNRLLDGQLGVHASSNFIAATVVSYRAVFHHKSGVRSVYTTYAVTIKLAVANYQMRLLSPKSSAIIRCYVIVGHMADVLGENAGVNNHPTANHGQTAATPIGVGVVRHNAAPNS